MDIKAIGKLMSIMEGSTMNVLDVSEGEFHLRIEKSTDTAPAVRIRPSIVEAEPADSEIPKGDTTNWNDFKEITSPLVGCFKTLSSAGLGEDLKVGDQITIGQGVCAVEAMKLMNEIQSDFAGEIMQILVNDGDIVEFGQVLYRVKEV